MKTQNIVEKIKTRLEDFEKERKALCKELKQEFPNLLLPLFQKYPKVKNIRWTQYTPFFNDGEECTFSANVSYLDFNYDIENNKECENEISNEASEEFTCILKSIDKSFYKDLFGDHVEVIVYSDGRIETEEYEHD